MIFLNLSKPKWALHTLSKFVLSLCWCATLFAVPAQAEKTRVLPLLTFYSTLGEGELYNWWAENSSQGDMKTLSAEVWRFLTRLDLKKGQYLKNEDALKALDVSLQVSRLTNEQKIDFAKKTKVGLVVTGDLKFSASPLLPQGVRVELRTEVLRVKTAQVIAESRRLFDLPLHEYRWLLVPGVSAKNDVFSGWFLDLNEKIDSYKPDLSKSPKTQLVLTGTMTEPQMKAFIRRLHNLLSAVEVVKVVSMEREQLILSVDGVSATQLGEVLRQTSWKGYFSQVVSTDSGAVVFDIKPRSSIQ